MTLASEINNLNIISDNESVKRVIRHITQLRKKIRCRIKSQLTFPRSPNQLLAELKTEAKSNSHSHGQSEPDNFGPVLASACPLAAITRTETSSHEVQSFQDLVSN